MSDSLYTAVSSVTGFQQLVNTPVHVGTDYVAISGTIISEDTPRWNRTALSVESNVVPVTGSWNSTNTTLVANSSQWAEAKADIAEVAAASANWTTGYNNSLLSRADLAGVAGVSANWTTGYNNSLLSRADLAGVAGVSANWTTGYNNSLLGRADLAGVAGVSANWTTAYTRSDGVVTIHSDVSNAGSGAIITTDERDKFTRAWTNVSGNSASYSSSFNSSEIAAASARYTRTALSLETNVAPATGSWNSTNTTLVANSSQWAEAKADIAEVAAVSANWTSGYNASVLSRADLAGVAGVSANWTTAYTRSDGVVTIHSDVSNAGSGAIITTDERDKFTRAWTNVSSNSASYSSSFNSSEIAAASARWNTNATTEVAAASARWNRTALSVETNVVPSTGSWNSTNTTVNVNSADWSYVAANSAGGTAPGRLSVDSEAIYTTVSTDASYFDVMALLHFEDANAATSTSDDSFSRRAVSFAGTAQISTAQKKFGTASLLLDGNSDYVSLANSADLDLGTSPFTIECWFYYNAATAPEYATIFDRGDGSGGGTSPFWLAIKDDSDTYRLVGTADAAGGSGNDIFENYEAATISNNTWYHLALVRDGNNFYTYLNGTVAWALTGSTSSAMADNNEPLYIGARGQSGTGAHWGGYIDEFRLTVGTCRYAGGITFTPSTDGLPGETRFNQTVITGVSASTGMTSFQLEDDDGTEVAVSEAKEVKFIGSGITTNWTDTSTGSDGDPYDLTFTVDAAQTGITSLLATDIKIGEDDETKIDFETADEIHFYAANVEQVYLGDNIFGPQSDSDVDLGSTGVRWKDAYVDSITVTGEVDGASLDISGNADIDGTLEADVITVSGTALSEYIADTAGAMVTGNTETGIAVTYQDGDNTIDFAIAAAQTTITSVLAADLKFGEDDQTKIDFETADEIHFYAANVHQVKLIDNAFTPVADSDVDLGTSSLYWKDAYIDTITTTGDVTLGGSISVTEAAIANGDYILFLDGGSTGAAKKEAFADVATLLGGDGLNATNSVLKMDIVGLTDLTNHTFGTANYGVGDQLAVTDSSASSATKRVKFPVEIGVACSDETSNLTTGTAKVTFRMPHQMTVTEVRANVNTAPAGSTILVDINNGGSTLLSTKLMIDAGETTSKTAATAAVISQAQNPLADDAIITVDIDQIGSSTAGKGLKIWLIGYR